MALNFYEVKGMRGWKKVKEMWSIVGGRAVETWVISKYDYM